MGQDMHISVERGRMVSASCHWIHFILFNTDIMTTLNKAPLVLVADDRKHFRGTVFGVKVALEIIGEEEPCPCGEVNIVADVRMPFGLGRTHTVAHYRYRLVDEDMTAIDLRLELETNGIVMAIYAVLLRRRIDAYLSRVISDNERAAVLVQGNDPSIESLLCRDQLDRIALFRATYEDTVPNCEPPSDAQTIGKNTTVVPELDRLLWDSELTELTELYAQFHGRADKLQNELIRIRETRDSVAVLLIARRMLEVIVTQVCQRSLSRPRGNEPLAGVIDKMARSECAPEYVMTSMRNLNRLCTYGAHPKDFSPRQVREALMALCSIMEWYALYCQCTDDNNEAPTAGDSR
jgi:hypothetical protein